MTRVFLVGLTALALGACATSGTTTKASTTQRTQGLGASAASQPAAPKPAVNTSIVKRADEGSATLSFVDLNMFDTSLSGVMKNTPDEVVVEMPSQFDLNNVPERMNKWLSAVEESGGEVKLERVANANDPNTRGVAGLMVSLAMKLFNLAKTDPYSIAKNYKTAVMTYDEASGKVTKVSFYR